MCLAGSEVSTSGGHGSVAGWQGRQLALSLLDTSLSWQGPVDLLLACNVPSVPMDMVMTVAGVEGSGRLDIFVQGRELCA